MKTTGFFIDWDSKVRSICPDSATDFKVVFNGESLLIEDFDGVFFEATYYETLQCIENAIGFVPELF